MKTINLLPKEEQKEIQLEFLFSHFSFFWIITLASLLVFLGLALGTKIYLNHKIQTTQAEIDLNQATLNSSDFKSLQDQVLELNASIKEVNNFIVQHYYWSKALVVLANLLPKDVQLNQVLLSRSTGRIDIAGQAATRESVIALWAAVIKSDYFKNINFPLANLEKAKIADFTFTFYVNKNKINQP